MKKFILPLLLILFVSTLVAAQSEASDVVGYFKFNIASGGYLAVSVPFNHTDLDPNIVLGSQFGDGDELTSISSGDASYYYGLWEGDVAAMNYGEAYWIQRSSDNAALDFFLLGQVDPQPFTIRIKAGAEGSFTCFSLNEATEIPIIDLDFPGVTEGDEITDMQTGDAAYYYGIWEGFDSIIPGHTYWYQSGGTEGFDWTYTPVGYTPPIRNVNPSTSKK